jgi:hypothetical protein
VHVERPVAPPLQRERIADLHVLLLELIVTGIDIIDLEADLDRLFARARTWCRGAARAGRPPRSKIYLAMEKLAGLDLVQIQRTRRLFFCVIANRRRVWLTVSTSSGTSRCAAGVRSMWIRGG